MNEFENNNLSPAEEESMQNEEIFDGANQENIAPEEAELSDMVAAGEGPRETETGEDNAPLETESREETDPENVGSFDLGEDADKNEPQQQRAEPQQNYSRGEYGQPQGYRPPHSGPQYGSQPPFMGQPPFSEQPPFSGQYHAQHYGTNPPPPYENAAYGNYYEPRPQKSNNKGLKIFCILLALVVVATLSVCVAYFVTDESQSVTGDKSQKSVPKVELETRPESDAELSENYTDAFATVTDSVVSILVYSPDSQELMGSASGVIYSSDGYIVTNDHIYESVPNAKFLIRLYNGSEYKASYVAGDTRSDLAVIKIDEAVSGLVPATFGDSEDAIVGEHVITIGYPAGYGSSPTLTHGILSAVDRRVTGTTTNYASSFLQTDATINPGNSGGALCNMYGQVIGITSSKLAGDEYDAVSFAIPTSTMKRVVEGLIKDGCVADRAKLGITYAEIDLITSETNRIPRGVMIQSVSEDSDLAAADIAQGDIITHVNGVEILTSEVLLEVVEASKAGDKVELTIYRASSAASETVTVAMLADEGSSSYTTETQSYSNYKDYGFGFFGE